MHAMQGNQTYQLRASYLELYDEQITDLLAVEKTGLLTIREDVCNESARVYVEGLTEVELLNGEHRLHLEPRSGTMGRDIEHAAIAVPA
jgi:hypothetical protein